MSSGLKKGHFRRKHEQNHRDTAGFCFVFAGRGGDQQLRAQPEETHWCPNPKATGSRPA